MLTVEQIKAIEIVEHLELPGITLVSHGNVDDFKDQLPGCEEYNYLFLEWVNDCPRNVWGADRCNLNAPVYHLGKI